MAHPDSSAEIAELARHLRNGRFDDEGLTALLSRLNELLGDHDINALHVPQDSGPYRAEIVELLHASLRAGGAGSRATPVGIR